MLTLSDLERAVLSTFAEHDAPYSAELRHQVAGAQVSARANTGAGFFTNLLTAGAQAEGAPSPLGPVSADVDGIEHGMGFLLWLKAGVIDCLEGYTYEADLTGVDLMNLRPSNARRELLSGSGW